MDGYRKEIDSRGVLYMPMNDTQLFLTFILGFFIFIFILILLWRMCERGKMTKVKNVYSKIVKVYSKIVKGYKQGCLNKSVIEFIHIYIYI